MPYSNRIRAGRFRFRGRSVVEPLNRPPERHAIHGHGWQARWRPTEVRAAAPFGRGRDNCFVGWGRRAKIDWPELGARLVMRAEAGREDTGMPVLEPGETLRTAIVLTLEL